MPDYLFSTVGGNTSCVEIATSEPFRLVFDAGSGLRDLGWAIREGGKAETIHLFLSHFHWDHIQGLPFFGPGYNPANTISVYSPFADLESILSSQMRRPYFPVELSALVAIKQFVHLEKGTIHLGGVSVSHKAMNHPGGCYSFAIREKDKKVVYATDTELSATDFHRTPENIAHFDGADALILDAQYTLGDAIEKQYWGHSSFSMAADFAVTWKIRKLVLFHHEPEYSDQKIDSILKSATWYLKHIQTHRIEVVVAREGLEIDI